VTEGPLPPPLSFGVLQSPGMWLHSSSGYRVQDRSKLVLVLSPIGYFGLARGLEIDRNHRRLLDLANDVANLEPAPAGPSR